MAPPDLFRIGLDDDRTVTIIAMRMPDFLNVDLDIESTSDLTLLQKELGRKVYAMTDGPVSPGCFLLRLETTRQYKTPDDTICAFCSIIEQLPPKEEQCQGQVSTYNI